MKEITQKVVEKAFELVIPFLEESKESNPNSMVEWLVDDQNQIGHVFVCPAYTDEVLSYMHPVISIDAAHLKLAYRGTIFIYLGLTGNDREYILAFGISVGNTKVGIPSTTCLQWLVHLCHWWRMVIHIHSLCLSQTGIKDWISPWQRFFPNNHTTNCVHHNKQNVKSRFGAKAAEIVFLIAPAFSMIQEEPLLEQLKTELANVYEYLQNIQMEYWHNTQWILT